MTVWERIGFWQTMSPMFCTRIGVPIWMGPLVTAIITIDGRDVAVYGHDFTVRAGSMDATNGKSWPAYLRWRRSGLSLWSA